VVWSDGASSGLAGVGSWTSGCKGVAVARSLQSKRQRATGATATARKKTKGNGVNPAPGRPIYRGPLNLFVAVPSTVQNASTALSREISEKIKAEFSPTGYSYDLNLSLGR
jgi:hypothetical protein